MDLKTFLEDYTKVLCDDFGDGPYEAMRFKYGGMASPRTAKLLNFGVKCLDTNEIYVEIGTHTGYTLLSAGYETTARLIAIDDFRLSRIVGGKVVEPLSILQSNLETTEGLSVSIIVNDFRKANLANETKEGRSVGLFFIDGDHTYEDVFESFKWVEPYLSQDAVIVLDDIRIPGVTEGMRDWLKDHKDYEEIFYCKTFTEQFMGRVADKLFHNGIAIVRYHRA